MAKYETVLQLIKSEIYKNGLNMPKLKNVQLLKFGKIPLPNGEILNADESLINDLVTTYDPENSHEAPAILGHDADSSNKPNDGAPAFGWLEKLYSNANGLYGDFDITEAFADWIKNKLYKKLSISFYPKESPMSPAAGKAYMRHVAFLGAEPPVVKGLEPYMLSEKLNLTEVSMYQDQDQDQNLAESETLTTEKAEEMLRALLADGEKGYKDTIVSFDPVPTEANDFLIKDGMDITGKFLNEQGIPFSFNIVKTEDGYTREFAPSDAQEAEAVQADQSGLNTKVSEMAEELIDELEAEPEVESEELEQLEDTETSLTEAEAEAEATELDMLKQEMAEMRTMLAEEKAKSQKAKDTYLAEQLKQYAEGLYQSGRVLPAMAESTELSEFMFKLAKQDEMLISLNESNQQNSAIDWFKGFLNKLPVAIELNEVANTAPSTNKPMANLPGNIAHDDTQAQLHGKVISLCEQKGLNYKDPVTYRTILKEAIK